MNLKPMIGGMFVIVMVVIMSQILQSVILPPPVPPPVLPETFDCPYDDLSFPTLEELIRHISTEHPNEPQLQLIEITWG